MTPTVKVCNSDYHELTITDLTQDSLEYIPEDLTDNLEVYYEQNKFKYSETNTVNVIQYNTTDSETISDILFTDHCTHLDEQHYNVPKDGFITIHHLILPTVDWLNNEISNEKSILNKGITIYVTNGERLYKYNNSQLEEVEALEVIEVNTENTTISRISVDNFIICFLYDCYISLCKNIFSNTNYRCNSKSNLKDFVFKRDFIWMTINIIKYHVEKGYLMEAQRLLEEVNYCGSFCSSIEIEGGSNGCGCSI